MQVDGFLCDYATVREGLLHILGGGITRLWREQYPANFGVSLAMVIILHPTEAMTEHKFEIHVQSEDGSRIAGMEGGFMAGVGAHKPGELVAAPVVLNLHNLAIPSPGGYSVEILVDKQHQRSLQFRAELSSNRSLPPSPAP